MRWMDIHNCSRLYPCPRLFLIYNRDPLLLALFLSLAHVLDFIAYPRLGHLVSTLPPVLSFHAYSRFCSLSTALLPVLDLLACPRLCCLL